MSRALDVLRDKGAVREFPTHDAARAALVRSWADATRAGKSALLVASRNDDVRVMNELARAAVRGQIGEREDVTIAYGKDEVRDFGELLARAQRDQGKVLVRDVERVVSARVAREQERERAKQRALAQEREREQERLRAPVIEHRQEPKIDRDRDRSRGWGMGR